MPSNRPSCLACHIIYIETKKIKFYYATKNDMTLLKHEFC